MMRLAYILFICLIQVSCLTAQSVVEVSRNNLDASLIIQDSTDRTIKAFFPIGQSNADGRILETEWPAELRDSLKDFQGYFHETERFYSAKAGFNISDQGYWVRGDSLKNGLEIPLYRYLKYFGKWKFLKITRGGAPVTFFNFDANNLSNRDGYAIQLSSFLSLSPEINLDRSFWFWIQGETEANENTLDINYASDLQQVINDIDIHIREDLFGIMILTNAALDQGIYPNTTGIRQQQSQVAILNGMPIYDPSGLGLRDSVHYDAEAYQLIAKALADFYYQHFYSIQIQKTIGK
jgi:hypothetical protein